MISRQPVPRSSRRDTFPVLRCCPRIFYCLLQVFRYEKGERHTNTANRLQAPKHNIASRYLKIIRTPIICLGVETLKRFSESHVFHEIKGLVVLISDDIRYPLPRALDLLMVSTDPLLDIQLDSRPLLPNGLVRERMTYGVSHPPVVSTLGVQKNNVDAIVALSIDPQVLLKWRDAGSMMPMKIFPSGRP